MKILLIMPQPNLKKTVFDKLMYPSLTLQQIAGITPSHHNVKIINERYEIINFNENPDLIGISITTYSALRGYEIADVFRKKGKIVVFGGYHASLMPEETKKHADSVVIGEAENTWPQLLKDLESKKLKKFYYNKQLVKANDIPPARHDIGNYTPFMEAIQTSRGCPVGCEFCTMNIVEGNTFRGRPIDNVIEEMKLIRAKKIFFVDASLTNNLTYTKQLFKKMREVNKIFVCFGNINAFVNDDKLLQLASEAGVLKWCIGFESISQLNINQIGKGTNDVKNYVKAVKKIKDYGMMITIFSSANAGNIAIPESIKQTSQSTSLDWTFIAYLDGDNNLEPDMIKFFNDMEKVGSSSHVNIIALIDDYDIWGGETRCYYIEQDNDPNNINSVIVGDTTEKNMGDPQTLIDFVCWTADNYPAEHYCLVMADHCMGWIRMCSDETSSDSLNMTELKTATAEINNHLGQKLDIMLIDACLGTMIEILYQVKNYIDIGVSTEGFMMKHYIQFDKILQELVDNPSFNAREYTGAIVNVSTEIVGFCTDDVDNISQAVDDLANALIDPMPPKKTINKALLQSWLLITPQTPCFPRDLYNFAECISNEILYTTPNQRYAAQTIMSLIKGSIIKSANVVMNCGSGSLKNGIAISLPSSNDTFPFSDYEKLDFAMETSWDEFLNAFFGRSIIQSTQQQSSNPQSQSSQPSSQNNLNLQNNQQSAPFGTQGQITPSGTQSL
ncbi:MAG: radical SAM protein [Thermoplasmatales archaeon]|nr:radical SAM protein [Thermoplasmatales archaeon]